VLGLRAVLGSGSAGDGLENAPVGAIWVEVITGKPELTKGTPELMTPVSEVRIVVARMELFMVGSIADGGIYVNAGAGLLPLDEDGSLASEVEGPGTMDVVIGDTPACEVGWVGGVEDASITREDDGSAVEVGSRTGACVAGSLVMNEVEKRSISDIVMRGVPSGSMKVMAA
jgi:hypothetical protein